MRVEILTDFPDRFKVGGVLRVDGRPSKIVRSRSSAKGMIIALDTIANRTIAESLRGKELTIPADEVEQLPEGSYYHFQLLDIEVSTEQGEYLGKISDILSTEGNDVYVVTKEGQESEVLIPALKDVIQLVNVREKKMVVKLPEIF